MCVRNLMSIHPIVLKIFPSKLHTSCVASQGITKISLGSSGDHESQYKISGKSSSYLLRFQSGGQADRQTDRQTLPWQCHAAGMTKNTSP